MHDIIVTPGLVVSKRGVGEANTVVSIVTQDLGLVRASARSTRVEKSKLRYALEPLTVARFSFVKGRHEWRLVGAEDAHRALMSASVLRRSAAGRMSRLVMRLVQGQEPVPELYRVLIAGFHALTTVSEEEVVGVEYITVLRVVGQLGYLPHIPEFQDYLATAEYRYELNMQASVDKSRLAQAINEALKASGL